MTHVFITIFAHVYQLCTQRHLRLMMLLLTSVNKVGQRQYEHVALFTQYTCSIKRRRTRRGRTKGGGGQRDTQRRGRPIKKVFKLRTFDDFW